jgi:hypothetical protein
MTIPTAPARYERLNDTERRLAERVAAHIGTHLTGDGRMPCPECGGDYGPNATLADLAVYENGYLPGAPLLVGVCLDCEHMVSPAPSGPL